MSAGNTAGLIIGSTEARESNEGLPAVKSVAGESAITASGKDNLVSLIFNRLASAKFPRRNPPSSMRTILVPCRLDRFAASIDKP